MKIAICIPSRDHWHAIFGFCLARLTGQFTGLHPSVGLRVLYVRGSLLPNQRTDLVEAALKWEATHLLWLDTDMRFPGDTLDQLIEAKTPIIGANYVKRSPPHEPVAIDNDGKRVVSTRESPRYQAIAQTGLGVVLTEASVFREIEKPWFALPWIEELKRFGGEDMFFFTQARNKGFKVLIDHRLSLEVTHTGELEYTNEMAEVEGVTLSEEDAA